MTPEDAIEHVARGGLVAFPTETTWGLGADARSEVAVEKLRAWKERDRAKPVSVLVSGVEDFETAPHADVHARPGRRDALEDHEARRGRAIDVVDRARVVWVEQCPEVIAGGRRVDRVFVDGGQIGEAEVTRVEAGHIEGGDAHLVYAGERIGRQRGQLERGRAVDDEHRPRDVVRAIH
ncbi:MAG: Sua5/YciO/YrdC/YwlC family protein, partial [Myxococcota bacterium]